MEQILNLIPDNTKEALYDCYVGAMNATGDTNPAEASSTTTTKTPSFLEKNGAALGNVLGGLLGGITNKTSSSSSNQGNNQPIVVTTQSNSTAIIIVSVIAFLILAVILIIAFKNK
jgi:hypothetical protein